MTKDYIQSCLDFMSEERKAIRKEEWRLINLKPKDHNDEGQTIVNAKVVKVLPKGGGTVLSFPAQFTKIRDDKRVTLYRDGKECGENTVKSVDYTKNEITLHGDVQEKEPVLLIEDLEITPFSIIASLKKLQLEPNEVSTNLMNRECNVETFGEFSIDNVIKSVGQMYNSSLILQGCPGGGKSFTGRAIISYLLKNKKSIAITSNSHSAINNLCNGIVSKDFNGAKIVSKSAQNLDHELFKNIHVTGKEIDHQISEYNVVAGTCFALSRIKDRKFDFLIVDEASQLKMSFLLSVSRIANNIVILGDQNQLQSISVIDMAAGGESVLDYMLQGQRVVPKEMGYFLNKTYRMEGKIAAVISEVFYEGKMSWNKKEEGRGIKLITSNHAHGQKMSQEEANDVLTLYKSLLKKGLLPEDIMIISPYNAQVNLIKSMVKNEKTIIGSSDLVQGMERKAVIISFCGNGSKKEATAFATNVNRVNVSVSRAEEEVFLVVSPGLQKSPYASKEFKQVLKMAA